MAMRSAKRAAWPVTFVVSTEKPKKPAAFTKPAVTQSSDANLTLCE